VAHDMGNDTGQDPPEPDWIGQDGAGRGRGEGGPEVAECGFVVVSDPARWVRSWRVARRDADRVRAALDGAGLGPLFGTVRADVDGAGDPIVVLGGAAGPGDVERLVGLLAPGSVRRVDGAA
jgi:hypothetical protein